MKNSKKENVLSNCNRLVPSSPQTGQNSRSRSIKGTIKSDLFGNIFGKVFGKTLSHISACLLLLPISLLFFGDVKGQQYTDNKADHILRGSGRVNPTTLGMEIDIPLGSYPGRGINLPISLNYSSKVWRIDYTGSNSSSGGVCIHTNEARYAENTAARWTTSLAIPYIEYTGKDNLYMQDGHPQFNYVCDPDAPPSSGNYAYIRRLNVHLPGGETHELRADDTINLYAPGGSEPFQQHNWNRTFRAVDGSNLKYVEDSASGIYRLLMPDGSFYDFDGTIGFVGTASARKAVRYGDRNGNTILYNDQAQTITDTLGRTLVAPVGKAAPANPTTQTYALPGLAGNYKFYWKQLKGGSATESGLTDFSQALRYHGSYYRIGNTGWGQYSEQECLFGFSTNRNRVMAGNLFNPVVLTEIELPTGQKYKFTYDIYGRIERIYYPTGGEERFVYNRIAPLVNDPSDSNNVTDQANYGVTNRKVYPTAGQEGTFYQWLYSAVNDTNAYTVGITAPDGTKTERLLHRSNGVCIGCPNGTYGYDNGLAGTAYEERALSGTGQLVSKKLITWTHTTLATSGGTTIQNAHWHPRVTQEKSIVYDPATGSGVSTTAEYEYDGDLNQRETPVLMKKSSQYAFVPAGGALPATPSRVTETTFLINDPTVLQATRDIYKNRNLVGLASEIKVLDPSNQAIALSKSQLVYDETAYPLLADGSAAQWSDPNTNYRANLTTTRTWVKETNSWIETHAQFNNFGNLRKQWDSSGDANRFIETQYASQYNYAFPTKIIAPAPDPSGVHGTNATSEITKTYDLTTGLALSITDVNGQTTTTEYDAALRPKKVIPPTGGAITETFYGVPDTSGTLPASQRFVKVKRQIDATNWTESTAWLDGLGRTVKTQTKDAQGDVFTEVQYDSVGRIKQVSNPYRQGDAQFWSKPRYDTAGRIVEGYAPAPDGQTGASLGSVEFGVSTVAGYVGTYVTGTDASGRKARSITNALGQIIRVDEPTANNNLGTLASPTQPTYYNYDAQGELVKIQQGAQNRYFMYDSLGRLIRVRQPEQTVNANLNTSGNPENNQWTAGFTYDVFGNVVTATDVKGTIITNGYDNAGRVKTRGYSDGVTPTVSYYYDGKGLSQAPLYARGNLTKISSSVSEDRYTSFDNFGRMLASQQITDGQTYSFGYQYNLAGDLIEETYPSGRVVKNTIGSDGGLTAVKSSKSAGETLKTYASNFDYTAAGAVKAMMLGNGRYETAIYNERLQLTQIGLGTNLSDTSLWKADYEYGELNADGVTVDAAKNTGSVAKHTITLPTTSFVQTYKFDELNRLTEARETTDGTQNWMQTFGYDRYGNRTSLSQNVSGVATAQTPAVDANTNRFTTGQGYVYDFNGNLIQDAQGRTFTFNGDDKQTQVVSSNNVVGTYYYDGSGARVKKVTASETLVYVYDGFGNLAAEYSSIYYSTTRTSYLTTDNLGSPRVITDHLGNVTARRDFLPFGEELYAGVGQRSASLKYSTSDTDFIRQRFTGYEKDGETLLDFAEARMYESRHGRFTAADPLLNSASLSNPQTFNRYTYTGNNPINYTDPFGLKYYEEKSTGNIYWSDTPMDSNLYNDLTGQTRLVTQPSDNFRNQGVSDGSLVEFNESRQVSVVGQRELAQLAETTGTNVQATYDEILETTATTLNSAAATFAENAGFTPLPVQHTTGGRVIGNIASLAVGGGLTAAGGGMIAGGLGGEVFGLALDGTGAGAIVGIPVGVLSAASIVTGVVSATAGTSLIANTVYNMAQGQPTGISENTTTGGRTKKTAPVDDPPGTPGGQNAQGPHTTVKKDSSGTITGTETWVPNSRGGFSSKKRVDLNPNGSPHFNKKTGKYIPTPHTQGKSVRGGVRPARKWEIPK